MGSTTRRNRARARRSEITDRVKQAVIALIADGTPFTELPVQTITDAASVPRSTFYLHFPDKSELLLVLADEAIERLREAAAACWLTDHRAGPATIVEGTEQLLTAIRSNLPVVLAVIEVASYDGDVHDYWLAKLDEFTQLGRMRIEHERGEGVVPAAVDSERTAAAITWMFEGVLVQHCRSGNAADDRAVCATLARSAWLMVYGRPPDE